MLKNNPTAKILAGGTDLLVNMKHRVEVPPVVVNLKMISDLAYIHHDNDAVRIGALTPLKRIYQTPLIVEELPALARAQKMQQRASRVGFDWPDIEGVEAKIVEELAEVRSAESAAELEMELGDLFFALVNWAQWLDVDAESALRGANGRFERRFRLVERFAAERDLALAELSIDALDELWEEAKASLATEASPAAEATLTLSNKATEGEK